MGEHIGLHKVEQYLLWLGLSVLSTAAIAWIAFQIQQEQIAPAVLFPLLVGAALGAGNLACCRYAQVPRSRWPLAAAVVWGLLAVIGQDYIGHRHRLRLYDIEMSHQSPLVATAEQAELRPGFAEYLASIVRARPVWWLLDLLLTSGASLAVTAWGIRRDRFKPCSAI